MNTVEDRLLAIQDKLKITKTKIGELAGSKTPSQSVTNWIKRNSISKNAARLLAQATGYNYEWILNGDGLDHETNIKTSRLIVANWDDMPDKDKYSGEFVTVPVLDVSLSAGDGSCNNDENEMFTLPFRAYTLKKRGINPNESRVVRVNGDSMEPRLYDNDSIAIDMSDKKIRDGKIYAIRIGNDQWVKVLIRNPDNTITVRSLNPIYKDVVITKDRLESGEFTILGRMWWHSSLID